jgi:hypothetical protein
MIWILFLAIHSGSGIALHSIETGSKEECEQVRAQIVKMPHITPEETLCVMTTRPRRV